MSYAFDGVDDLMTTPTVTLGSIQSVVAWVKHGAATPTAAEYLVAHSTTNTPRFIAFTNSNRLVRIRSGRATTDGVWDSANNVVALNTWQHLAITYDGSATANHPLLYVNTVLTSLTRTATPAGALDADNRSVYIGNISTAAGAWAGLIGMLAIWTRVLSPDEILRVYWQGPTIALQQLVAWYPFAHTPYDRAGIGAGLTPTVTGALFNAETEPRLSRVAA
jgi:hypothetical protein